MDFKVNVILFLNLLIMFQQVKANDVKYNSTEKHNSTLQRITIIHRRPDTSSSFGGNRLSLLNSRYSRRPRRKNLDLEQLAEILGDFYDPNWMSIDTPTDLAKENKGVIYSLRPDAWPYQELIKALRTVNLTKQLGDSLSGAQVIALERWFLKKASCPVKYAWENIGPMFWPRWIKRGECAKIPGTCSWPPGMHCVETARTHLQVLRWQCRLPKSKSRRRLRGHRQRLDHDPSSMNLRCQWIRVPYPITSACRCTC